MMILFKKASDTRYYLDKQLEKNKKIGFVPTMGALHAGHLSLIEYSKRENDITVCSIFVNPTQFNDSSDFEKYPVTIEKDILALEQAGCDLLFLPSVKEIYPAGTAGQKHYELGRLETLLEGKFRPGHFQGVCMVVDRLLGIIAPHQLYLGQKDYQQCLVINRLVELIGSASTTRVVVCPTQREADGLAMSSRNLRLNEAERKRAPAIYQALLNIKSGMGSKTPPELKETAAKDLRSKGFRVDYVEIADARSLEPVNQWDGRPLVALVAAFNNEVRLIDNMLLGDKD